MNKIILIFAILLFSTGAYARGCDERSLRGYFSYEVSGVNAFYNPLLGNPPPLVTQSTHVVGRAVFNGQARTVDIIGKGAAAGALEDRIGHGSYTVDSATCIATGYIDWEVTAPAQPEHSEFYIVMDNQDNSDEHSSNLAYHANVVVSSDAPYSSSASGSLTRYIRQFH